MKKQMKAIAVTVIALLVVAGSYFIIQSLIEKPEKPPEDTPLAPSISLLKYDYTTISRIDVNNPLLSENYSFTGELISGQTVYKCVQDEQFGYDPNQIISLLKQASNLEATAMLEDPSEDETYGFTEETLIKITCTKKDGTIQIINIGDSVPSNGGYYVKIEGDETIYMCSLLTTMQFLMPQRYYRDKTIYPPIDENMANIGAVYLASDDLTLGLEAVSAEETETSGGKAYSTFKMTEPYFGYTSETAVIDNFISPVLSMVVNDIVKDNPEDLSEYGLEKPSATLLLYINGILDGKDGALVYRIGDGNDQMRYMMIENVPTIYLVQGDFSFLNVDPLLLFGKLIWLHNIKDVRTVSFKTPEGTDTLEVIDMTDNEDNGYFLANLNGTDVSENNARKIFMSSIQFLREDFYNGEIANVDYSITMTYKDGTSETLELTKYNARQYISVLKVSGEAKESIKSLVNITDVQRLLDDLDAIKQGEEIKRA